MHTRPRKQTDQRAWGALFLPRIQKKVLCAARYDADRWKLSNNSSAMKSSRLRPRSLHRKPRWAIASLWKYLAAVPRAAGFVGPVTTTGHHVSCQRETFSRKPRPGAQRLTRLDSYQPRSATIRKLAKS